MAHTKNCTGLLAVGLLLCLTVFSDVVTCQKPADSSTKTTTVKPVPTTTASLEEDVGSGDVDPSLGVTGDPVLLEDEAPHLVVKDKTGHPCLLATLNATMQVSYQVQEGIVHETYLAVADIQLPEDVQAKGVCGENVSSLLLQWGHNNTFHVNMTFTRKTQISEKDNATWAMTSMSITYDLSDKEVFPGASESGLVTLERRDITLFPSMQGFGYSCDRDIFLHVGSVDKGVDVSFHDVELAAFGVSSSEFPDATVYCSETQSSHGDEELMVPLIVACCLSAIVVIIVIGYVISRKVQEAREQSEYRPMP